MFRIFRLGIIVLSIATIVLAAFGLVGSYKNEGYLTKIYLLDLHLTDLKLSKLLTAASTSKRSLLPDVTSSVSLASSAASDLDSAISDVVGDVSYKDLGLSDVYSVSFWGYCRGSVKGSEKSKDGFDNTNVNFTWCSKPTPGYFVDPLSIFRHELNRTVNKEVSGDDVISSTIRTDLSTIVDNMTYKNLDLPGSLYDNLKLLNNLTKASFALILISIILAFISVVIQIVGCCVDPSNCCLSVLNFVLQFATFLTGAIGAGIATGAYYYVRGQINSNTKSYDIKSFLSIAFYAFVWSSVASSILVILFSLIGHCCGSCGGRKYKAVSPASSPDMGYEYEKSYH
ncbi:Piso0_001997 [Millerozyma farinosa CBS 7064]|uniref:Piso0_001997 protein n=1 Tax=Pichia sorbitophila (strain ATCC MYA-4447 / BCRC 22081 / CBS 7064 / NBRC 10061 / NRRL Y-12695) TaxID=559304 RepID=G8YBE8_PICSO|nr:Piso0_001997 [Millerozyma farinosa CBS 7064]